MNVIESSDIIALIRSFTTMFEQFTSCSVSQKWKRMVYTHPFLLRVLEFGNPLPCTPQPFKCILTTSGSRLRRLKIYNSSILTNQLNHLKYDIDELLQPMIVKNLEYLEIVGHVSPCAAQILDDILTASCAPQITIRFATCPCCLNYLDEIVSSSNKQRRIHLESPLLKVSVEPCVNCRQTNLWCSRCPKCERLYCSQCNYDHWRWSNVFNLDRLCACSYCVSAPSTLNCSIHCKHCHVDLNLST